MPGSSRKNRRKAAKIRSDDNDSSSEDETLPANHPGSSRVSRVESDHSSSSDEDIPLAASQKSTRKVNRLQSEESSSSSSSEEELQRVKKRNRRVQRVWSESDENGHQNESTSSEEFDEDSDSSDPEWESDWISEDEAESQPAISAELSSKSTSKPSKTVLPSSDSESSNGQAEKCPICLRSLTDQEVGTPESCDHCFCAECLQEWAKNVNTCPVDRQLFTLILVRKHFGGKVVRRIPVEPRRPEDNDPGILPDDATYCEVCGQCDREDRMLLCDGCDLGYHLECLIPPLEHVPLDLWFCPDCEPFIVTINLNDRRNEISTSDFSEESNDSVDLQQRLREEQNTRHHRTRGRSRQARLLPRTPQSERIRATIRTRQQQRTQNSQPSTSSLEADSNSVASSSRVTVSTTATRKTKSRITRRKTRRKRRKVRRKTTVRRKKVKKQKPSHDENGNSSCEEESFEEEEVVVRTKKRRRRRKRKYRKRKIGSYRRRPRTTRRQPRTARVTIPLTARGRIAEQLGVYPPRRPGQTIPDVKSKFPMSSIDLQRSRAGIPTLHLFGPRNQLDYFSSGSDTEVHGEGGLSVASQPRISTGCLQRNLNRKLLTSALSPLNNVTDDCDVVGSILDSQTLWHSRKAEVTIHRDGSLTVKNNDSLPKSSEDKESVFDKSVTDASGENVKLKADNSLTDITKTDKKVDVNDTSSGTSKIRQQAPIYSGRDSGSGGTPNQPSSSGFSQYSGSRYSGSSPFRGFQIGRGGFSRFSSPVFDAHANRVGYSNFLISGSPAIPPPFRSPPPIRHRLLPPPRFPPLRGALQQPLSFSPIAPHALTSQAPALLSPSSTYSSNVARIETFDDMLVNEPSVESTPFSHENDNSGEIEEGGGDEEEVDIYSDIEVSGPTVVHGGGGSEPEDNDKIYEALPPPPVPPALLMEFGEQSDEEKGSDTELIIDDNAQAASPVSNEECKQDIPESEKYDPANPSYDTDDDDDDDDDDEDKIKDKNVKDISSSLANSSLYCGDIPLPQLSNDDIPLPSLCTADKVGQKRTATLDDEDISSNRNIVSSESQFVKDMRHSTSEDDDDEADCPNFSIYSAETIDMARSTSTMHDIELPLQEASETVEDGFESDSVVEKDFSIVSEKQNENNAFKSVESVRFNLVSNYESEDEDDDYDRGNSEKKNLTQRTANSESLEKSEKIPSQSPKFVEVCESPGEDLQEIKFTDDGNTHQAVNTNVSHETNVVSQNIFSENSDEELTKSSEQSSTYPNDPFEQNSASEHDYLSEIGHDDSMPEPLTQNLVEESSPISRDVEVSSVEFENESVEDTATVHKKYFKDSGPKSLEEISDFSENDANMSSEEHMSQSHIDLREENLSFSESHMIENVREKVSEEARVDENDVRELESSFDETPNDKTDFNVSKDNVKETRRITVIEDIFGFDNEGITDATSPVSNTTIENNIQPPVISGLEGLETETISETEEAINFDDDITPEEISVSNMGEDDNTQKKKKKKRNKKSLGSSGGKSKVHGHSITEYEEGEIVDDPQKKEKKSTDKKEKSKHNKETDEGSSDKKTQPSKSDVEKEKDKRKKKKKSSDKGRQSKDRNVLTSNENKRKSSENKADDPSIEWKKPSKSTKERNYRDGKGKTDTSKSVLRRDRSASKENLKKDKKKKEKRKDLERYDVRKVVSEKKRKRKDEFGRDLSRDRSYSNSRSKSRGWSYERGRNKSRSLSRTRKSRSRGRSPLKSKRSRSRSRLRSLSRSRNKSRSVSRSRVKRRSKERPRKSRSRDKRPRSRSRSRSRGRHTRSKSRSRSVVRSRIRSRSRSPVRVRDRKERPHNENAFARRDRRNRRSWSRTWTPSYSRSRSRSESYSSYSRSRSTSERRFGHSYSRSFSRSWSRERHERIPVLNKKMSRNSKKLMVILQNTKEDADRQKKKEKKKKEARKSKDPILQMEKKKKKKDKSPAPSKEVFTSGDNILVSVNFSKSKTPGSKEGVPTTSIVPPSSLELIKRKHDGSFENEAAKRLRKDKGIVGQICPGGAGNDVKNTEKRKSKKLMKPTPRIAAVMNKKPVAIIDLDQSPFHEETPPPEDLIVLTDSDDDKTTGRDVNNTSEFIPGLSPSPKQVTMGNMILPHSPNSAYLSVTPPMSGIISYSTGPKTPPEPQVKFSISSKPQLRSIENPLREEEEMMDIDHLDIEQRLEEDLGDNINEIVRKGPNTPPEPQGPATPCSLENSPGDAYDPFDPTKSGTPSPAGEVSGDIDRSPSLDMGLNNSLISESIGTNEISQIIESDKQTPLEINMAVVSEVTQSEIIDEVGVSPNLSQSSVVKPDQSLSPALVDSDLPQTSLEDSEASVAAESVDSPEKNKQKSSVISALTVIESSKSPESKIVTPVPAKVQLTPTKQPVTTTAAPIAITKSVSSQQITSTPNHPAVPIPGFSALTPSNILNLLATPPTLGRVSLYNQPSPASAIPFLGAAVAASQRIALSASKSSLDKTPLSSKSLPLRLTTQNGEQSLSEKQSQDLSTDVIDMDLESPYSPASSEGDDLFEPPSDSPPKSSYSLSQIIKNTARALPASIHKTPVKSTQDKFDSLFGSSPGKITNKFSSRAFRSHSSRLDKLRPRSSKKEITIKMDEDQMQILDDLPSSAVEMQVKDKYLKKLNRQERVVEEVKVCLKPHYTKKHITKDDYKDILRRAVPKICHSKSGEINPLKISILVEAYVKKFRYQHKRKNNSAPLLGGSIKPKTPQMSKTTMWS